MLFKITLSIISNSFICAKDEILTGTMSAGLRGSDYNSNEGSDSTTPRAVELYSFL